MSDEQPEIERVTVSCPWKCGICSAVCKVLAVDYEAGGVIVDRLRCSRCMVCASVCPAGILKEALLA